jgi:hypothetical protein
MAEAYEDLERSEQLVNADKAPPTNGRDAAILALRALLEEWGEEPHSDSVVGLLEQAAQTEHRILELRAEATVLDRYPEEPDSVERGKTFVEAIRARLVNI